MRLVPISSILQTEKNYIMETSIYSESVRQYISLLQDAITRMAKNSANCKAWLIGIVTAGLAFSKNAELSNIWVLLFPTILFFFLDCYYLGLERRFIKLENNFLKALRANEDINNSIYSFNISSLGGNLKWVYQAMKSWSTTPFYFTIAVTIFILAVLDLK